jgi:Cytochrome c552/Cytochrome c554 and c-prime
LVSHSHARNVKQTNWETAAQRACVVVVVLFSAALGVGIVVSREAVTAEFDVTDRPIQIADDGYASSVACKACHPSQYETWRDSYHRRMTQVATPQTVLANFDGVQVTEVPGAPMRLKRRGSEFWAELDDPDRQPGSGTPPRIERQVVMITGSHHQQIYWYASGHTRVLGQLQAAYLVGERRWVPRQSVLLHPPTPPASETGSWNAICIACHTTNGKPKFDTPPGSRPALVQTVDSTAVEFGISCEACHGPSAEHAALNRRPWRRYRLHFGGPDPTVVQPLRLNAKRASQACGQCHSIWAFSDDHPEREANEKGLRYRPGQELLDTRFLVQPTKSAEASTLRAIVAEDPAFVSDSFWSDGTVRVSGREYNGLIESPCFKNARDEKTTLSCFSCHTMHQLPGDARPVSEWADDQLTPQMDGNEACLQCHTSFRTRLTDHTKHAPGSAGSSCYNCHMPYTSYGLLKAIRSHTITSPAGSPTQENSRPNACNVCHLDKTLAWTSETLHKWYGIPKADVTKDEELVAASLYWLLKGDAGQRALTAWSMGWASAQQASGTNWLTPFLVELLNDPYDAVRFIASRSLATVPGYADLHYDFTWPSQRRVPAALGFLERWRQRRAIVGIRTNPELLFDSVGAVQAKTVTRLLQQRNNRPVSLRE